MSDAPLMPKATAVWLVENTSLTFDQIADFCKLHPLEIKGIADGEVATGHQRLRSDLDRSIDARGNRRRRAEFRPSPASGDLQAAHARIQEGARRTLHPAVAPPGPPQRGVVALAQPSRAQGRADHASGRHDQAHAPGDPRAHPLEFGQSSAAGPGDARPQFANRPRFRGQSRRQGTAQARGRPQPDARFGGDHHRPTRRPRRRASSKCSAFRRQSRSRATSASMSIRCSASSKSNAAKADRFEPSLTRPPSRGPPGCWDASSSQRAGVHSRARFADRRPRSCEPA